MTSHLVRTALLATLACATAAPATAAAQSSARERERARERARVDRERAARERADRARDARARADRDRAEHMERERRAREAHRRDSGRRQGWLNDTRPRVSIAGGLDLRQFDGDDDRYVVHGGVEFRGRGGLGMRPEVLFAWSDPAPGSQLVPGPGGTPVVVPGPVGRSRALGVSLGATYTFLRGSAVRPYVIGGPGLVSTRTVLPAPSPGQQPNAAGRRVHHELDVGLHAGTGLELVAGPVRLFSEMRYFLTDSPAPRGFSGMVPITVGLRF